jgi:hypothetical protein
VGEEYTHNNNESMLVYEDAQGNREFFFFINDRLWKRGSAATRGQPRHRLRRLRRRSSTPLRRGPSA